jgi:antitoxin MazE
MNFGYQEEIMQVAKWGNSLAVRLPQDIVRELDIKSGDDLDIVKNSPRGFSATKTDKRAEFLERLKQFNWPLPEGYRFDRDEANER